jgi:hypothetical protein
MGEYFPPSQKTLAFEAYPGCQLAGKPFGYLI